MTIGTADMKRINRRYASVKKILGKDKGDKAAREAQKAYHQKVKTLLLYNYKPKVKVVELVTGRDFFERLDERAEARAFLLGKIKS